MKESYNPFKMWGSYVGYGIGLAIPLLMQPESPFGLGVNWGMFLLKAQVIAIPLFLVGWGVHSLIRKLT